LLRVEFLRWVTNS